MVLTFLLLSGIYVHVSTIYGIPSSLYDIKAVSFNDLLNQAITRFTCEANHVAIFSPSRSCSSSSYSLVCVPVSPTSGVTIPATFSPGDCVTVIATPSGSTALNMNSKTGIPFHMSNRHSARVMVRNTKRGGWGGEERTAPYYPFVSGRQFNLTVCAEASRFKAWVDDTAMFGYNHRDPLNTVTALQVVGNAAFKTIVLY